MRNRVACRCCAGPHSNGRHEDFCPVVMGEWCEDCGFEKCVCGPPVYTDPITGERVA